MSQRNTQIKPTRLIRLNKYLAECGLASRRKADEMIEAGKIKLNGKTVYELGVRIDPQHDQVTYNGRPVRTETNKVYFMFHKPAGVLTSMSDPEGRPTIGGYFKNLKQRVFPVGRLDWETEGLILITNDGEFANAIMHPKSEIPKTYMVKLDGQPTDQQLARLKHGVTIVGGRVKALDVERVKQGSDKYDWVKIVITEGKNRQVRRMFEKIGFDVKRLKRVAIGQLRLGSLKKGQAEPLTSTQIRRLFAVRKERVRQKSRVKPRA